MNGPLVGIRVVMDLEAETKLPAPRLSRMPADHPAAEVHPFKCRGGRT